MQNVHCPQHIDLGVEHRILDRKAHADLGGQMYDDIGPLIAKHLLQPPALYVEFVQSGRTIDILFLSGRQVIDDDDLMPLLHKPIDHVRSYESCPARHKYFHRASGS